MPFKTKHGSHYHMTEGCHGATIPCDTTGLTPCSDCCGKASAGGHGESQSIGIGGGSGFAGDTGEYVADDTRQDASGAIPSASPAVAERQAAFAAALQSGSLAGGFGLDASVPSVMGPIDPDALASLGQMSLDGNMASAPAPPIPPMPGNAGDGGFTIAPNGEIIRGGDTKGPRIAERFDAVAAVRVGGPDYAEKVRHDLVKRIDSEIDRMPDGSERERTRREAQRAWNKMHPEAPVLEWSRDDEGYVSDSSASVVVRHRNFNEMRAFNFGSNAIGYDYAILDKETGEDVTQEVHLKDLLLRQMDRRVSDIEDDIRQRAQHEVIAQRNDLYSEWLEGKRQESDLFKYHGGSVSWDARVRDELWREFVKDTGYTAPEPVLRPTDEEREALAELYGRQRANRTVLDDAMVRYDLNDDVVALIRPQYQQSRYR